MNMALKILRMNLIKYKWKFDSTNVIVRFKELKTNKIK